MTLAIFRSLHVVPAVLLVGGLLAWHLADPMPFGSREDENVAYLLTTGWVAVALYVVLALYAARRAAHRLRLSPELRWKVGLPALERAQSRLRELQNRVARRELSGKRNVLREARAILAQEGVQRILRVEVGTDPSALGMLMVTCRPREPLGRLAAWLQSHVWLGIAAAVVVWFHGGGRVGTPMGLLLNSLSAVVILSGIAGALLWSFGPAWLTRAERDFTVERCEALVEHYARKVAACEAALAGGAPGDEGRSQAELAVLRGQQQLVQEEVVRLRRLRGLLRGWRMFHVPVSVLLLALVAVHVLSIHSY